MRLPWLAAACLILAAGPSLISASTARGQSTQQISIDNYAFKPAAATVSVGSTVQWKNMDDDPHTVTADDGSFDSKGLGQGDSFSFRFMKPGIYHYHCAVHPFMKATVTVVADKPGASPAADSAGEDQ